MQDDYIKKACMPCKIITYKGTPFKLKKAKRNEVPASYRKVLMYQKHKHLLFEAMLYLVGVTELIRKEMSTCAALKWKKTGK